MRRAGLRRALAALALAASLAGCVDAVTGAPFLPGPGDGVTLLEANDRELVIATASPDSAVVAATLRDAGVAFESLSSIRTGPDPHWLISFAHPANGNQRAAELWRLSEVVFAVPVYRSTSSGNRLHHYNLVLVGGVDGTTLEDIDRAAALYEMEPVFDHGGCRISYHCFTLPERSREPALELARALTAHPMVVYAELNRSAIRGSGGG